MFDIRKIFSSNEFDAITHQGVLEHYSVNKIRRLLKTELAIVPLVIFSVPLNTPFNKRYFTDKLKRNLWSKKKWLNILRDFNAAEAKVAHQRTDNLLVVVSRN